MKPTQNQIKNWQKLFKEIPVSINNFYGDPLIQWSNTVKKLNQLKQAGHTGPIGIITKGKITTEKAAILSNLTQQGLKITVLISISEMPQFEKVGHAHRYENIRILNQYNIRNIAYFRPLTPPYNTSKEVIDSVFAKLNQVGAKVVVASGFRGDDNIVKDMAPDEVIEWTMRVKLMTKDVYNLLKENASQYGIKLFTRTACAVSYLCGDEKVYNPYYNSPNLVKCNELNCPLQKSCKAPLSPKKDSLELVKYLGYDVKVTCQDCNQKCNVQPDKRLNCPSCCTTCYILKIPRIEVSGKVGLGDLTFIRFITGMLTMQKGLADDGDKNIAKISFPNFPKIQGLQCLNSWFPYAHVGDTCFNCQYCIEKYYSHKRKNFGLVPEKIINLITKEI